MTFLAAALLAGAVVVGSLFTGPVVKEYCSGQEQPGEWKVVLWPPLMPTATDPGDRCRRNSAGTELADALGLRESDKSTPKP